MLFRSLEFLKSRVAAAADVPGNDVRPEADRIFLEWGGLSQPMKLVFTGVRFVDRQLRGPYALWHHTHTFEPVPGGTLLRDVVRYRLPFGPFGRLVERLFVRRDVERIFAYRHEVIARRLGGAL